MPGRWLFWLLAASAVAGLIAGCVTALWGRTPAGNTALVVPFAAGPAITATGWAALILRLRHGEQGRRLLAGSAAVGGAALLLALAAVFLPVALAIAGRTTTPTMALFLNAAVLLLVPPIGAALAAWLGHPPGPRGWGSSVAAALVILAGTPLVPGLAYLLVPLLVPLPLVLPLLLGRRVRARYDGGAEPSADGARAWALLAAGALAVPAVAFAGFVASVRG